MVAVLGFGGAWFAVLRPSGGGGGPASTADAVSRAHGAVATSKKAAARAEAAAGQEARSTGQDAPAARHAVAPAAPAVAPVARGGWARDLSAPILRELARGKVAVLLFWNRRAADDRAARRAVARVDRHHGKVKVHVASVSRVGDYGAITQGVEVLQSPTVLVIGPDHRARTISGYTDSAEVDQLVDAVRAAR